MSNPVWTTKRVISALDYLNIPRSQDYYDAIEQIADAVHADDGEAASKVAIKIAEALKEEDPDAGTGVFSLTALDRNRPIERIARSIVGNVRNWHRMYTRNRNWTTNFGNAPQPDTTDEDADGTGAAPTDGDGGTPPADQREGIDFNGLTPRADREPGGSSSDSYEYYSSSSDGGGGGAGGGGGDEGSSSSSDESGDTKSFGNFFEDPLDAFREDDTAAPAANAQHEAESEYRPGPRRSDLNEELELQSAHGKTISSRGERERAAADRAAALSRNEAFFQELVRRAELEDHPDLHPELRATFDDVVDNRVGSALDRIQGLAQRVAETNTRLLEGVDLSGRIEELQAQIAHSAVRAAERLVRGADPTVPDEDDHTHPVARAAAETDAKNKAKKAEADAEDVLLRAAKVRAAEMAEAGEIPDGVAIEEVVEAHLEEGRRARQAWKQKLTALPNQIARDPRFLEIAEQAAQAAVDRNERAARHAYTEAVDMARQLAPEGMPATAITEGLVSNVLREHARLLQAELARQQAEQVDATPTEAMSVATMDRIDAENRGDDQPSEVSPPDPDRNTMDRLDAQNALMNLSAADLVQRISAAIDVPDMAEALRLAGALAMLPEDEKGKFTGKSAREIVAMIIKAKQATRNRNSGPGSDAPGRDQRPPSGGAAAPAGAAGGSGTGAEPPAATTGPEASEDEPQYQPAAEAGVELTRTLIKQVDWDNFCEIYAIRLTDRTALLDTALAMVKKGADSKAALNAARDLVAACKKSGGVKVKNGKHMCAAVEHAMVSRAGGKRKLSKPLKASAVGEEETV